MASTKNGQEMMHERLKFTLSCVEKDYFSFTRYYSYGTRLCMISHFQTDIIFVKKITQPQFLAPKIYAKKA